MRQARPHQLNALKYARTRNEIALFMEMRLGKTMVAIRWADPKDGRRMVVAPITVLPNWEDELLKEGVKKSDIHYGTDTYRFEEGWLLMGYESLRAHPILSNIDFSTVILDESTKIRNPKAEVSRLLNSEFEHVPNKAVLSGLPNPEAVEDFFQQMKFLHGSFMGFDNFWSFRHALFYQPSWDPHNWLPKKGVEERIRKEVHRLSFVLTRKDAGLGPLKVYEKRYVMPNAKQRRLYKQVETEFAYTDGKVELATKWATTKFIWLARIAGGFSADGEQLLSDEKAREILDLHREELHGQKLVIWFRFNKELYHVKQFLEKKKVKVVSISGSDDLPARRAASEKFRNDKKTRMMLCQTKCGKYGLDWSMAGAAIYYSNGYDAEDRAQSEDRILNITQKTPLLYIDLVTKGTIDASVVRVLRQKHLNNRKFMDALVRDWLKHKGEIS